MSEEILRGVYKKVMRNTLRSYRKYSEKVQEILKRAFMRRMETYRGRLQVVIDYIVKKRRLKNKEEIVQMLTQRTEPDPFEGKVTIWTSDVKSAIYEMSIYARRLINSIALLSRVKLAKKTVEKMKAECPYQEEVINPPAGYVHTRDTINWGMREENIVVGPKAREYAEGQPHDVPVYGWRRGENRVDFIQTFYPPNSSLGRYMPIIGRRVSMPRILFYTFAGHPEVVGTWPKRFKAGNAFVDRTFTWVEANMRMIIMDEVNRLIKRGNK